MRHDVDVALARMDLFVLSSRTEGLPYVLLEAMRAGLPLVATRCTSLEQIIEEGSNGFSVPLNDAEALAGAIECVLADEEGRQRMGRRSREIFHSRFLVETFARNTEAAYLACLIEAGHASPPWRPGWQLLGSKVIDWRSTAPWPRPATDRPSVLISNNRGTHDHPPASPSPDAHYPLSEHGRYGADADPPIAPLRSSALHQPAGVLSLSLAHDRCMARGGH